MLYYSTNRLSPEVDFREALIRGLAPDGGLYLPERVPRLAREEISNFKEYSYPEIATSVLWNFLKDEIERDTLEGLCKSAYNFDIPLEEVMPGFSIMRLDQGPTASFKDFAARLMAGLMSYFLAEKENEITILTATSGDTGSAVANAYFEVPGIKLIVLFPENEVSELQRKQMTTLGSNITALSVNGKFDDCQRIVKKAFTDPELEKYNLSSANSINIGRLLPQMLYYFYAASRLVNSNEELIISVPSGNFGNVMGGMLAKQMGLPIRKFIISVNGNDEFPQYLKSGLYSKIEPSKNCLSSAMNVGHPSNLARLIDTYGGMMDEWGNISVDPDIAKIKNDLWSCSISDKLTVETIRSVWKQYNILLEPHGAVAWAGLIRYLNIEGQENGIQKVILETAHPAKFPLSINDALGKVPDIPDSLKGLEDKSESFERISSDYIDFKKYLLNF